MRTTLYNSAAPTSFSTLAEATWEVFRPYLSRYQWAFDDPSYSPRASEIRSAIQNRGKRGACTFQRENGHRYILPVMHARHFEQAITRRRKLYYVSYGSQALLYHDIDLHYAWQTKAEGERARQLIDRLWTRFVGQPVLFWADSSRGSNGYLKVDLQGMDYALANDRFDRLEKALQRFLAHCENLADIEVKGRVGFLKDGEYTWKQYGKLPVHLPGWNFPTLKEFRGTPTIPMRSLEALCRRIEAEVPAEVLERHKASKKSLGDRPMVKDGRFLVTPAIEKALLDRHGEAWPCMFADFSQEAEGGVWLGLQYYQPDGGVLTERELAARRKNQEELNHKNPGTPLAAPGSVEEGAGPPARDVAAPAPAPTPPANIVPAKPVKPFVKVNLALDDLATEADSFERQREALLQLSRYLKRVPTLEEALDFIREKRLFTGPWEQHQARRRARVQSILRFIARSFDASKCASGSVNVGKYDAWAAKKFPNGLVGRGGSSLTEDGEIIQGPVISVSSSFIAVFMAVVEFALVVDKNQDGTLPHRRAEELWNELYARGLVPVKFCARRWAVGREALAKYGIIKITDRNYGLGKAMQWEVGMYFPGLGLWKTPRQFSLLGKTVFTLGSGEFSKKEESNTRET